MSKRDKIKQRVFQIIQIGNTSDIPSRSFDIFIVVVIFINLFVVFFEEKIAVIELELKLCGYFCIVTSEKMTAKQALEIYKGRDASEKLFLSDKTFLGNHAIRSSTEESAASKIFIEFVALIIRNRMYNYLRDAMKEMAKKPNYMTVPAAIRELDKIEMSRQLDGVYRLDHAVTAAQKTILKAFGLTDASVKYRAEEIGKRLETGG